MPVSSDRLALAQLLKFAQNADELSHRDFYSFFSCTKLLHFMAPCSRVRCVDWCNGMTSATEIDRLRSIVRCPNMFAWLIYS